MQRVRKGEILVLLAPGFEEVDVSTVVRTLRRFGFSVTVVGLMAGPARGAHGLLLSPDMALSEIEAERLCAVVLPGGVQGARQLKLEPRLHILLRQVIAQGGYVLALDASYMVLRSAGIFDEFDKGSAPGLVLGWRSGAGPSERVVVEGQVIFGRDSGTAQESALTLVTLLENRA